MAFYNLDFKVAVSVLPHHSDSGCHKSPLMFKSSRHRLTFNLRWWTILDEAGNAVATSFVKCILFYICCCLTLHKVSTQIPTFWKRLRARGPYPELLSDTPNTVLEDCFPVEGISSWPSDSYTLMIQFILSSLLFHFHYALFFILQE